MYCAWKRKQATLESDLPAIQVQAGITQSKVRRRTLLFVIIESTGRVKTKSMEMHGPMPVLLPIELDQFWEQIRIIIREEVRRMDHSKPIEANTFQTPGLTYKPLYKMSEVCSIFNISRPTIYDWIKHGKLRPFKIRTRVYFLWNDIQELMKAG